MNQCIKRFSARLGARLAVVIIGLAALTLAAGCASTKVKRVDAGTQTDLSGYWNDTDVRIVCDSLIRQALESPRITAAGGRLPAIIVGRIKNDSDEHIDTQIISNSMRNAIINSGKADFVAGGDTRSELRAERQEQQSNASQETASALGNETGADFMLTGSVKTMVDREGGTSTRTYFVTAEITSIETNRIVWTGENSEIKKVIKRSGSKL